MARRSAASLLLLLLVVCLAVCVVVLPVGVAGKKRIDYDALERAWEAGDAREELRSPGDEQFEALAEKSDEEAKALGPQMVFVTLREDRANAHEALADVASRWKESLWNGGLDVTVYEIEQGKKLLVGLQRGVQVADLRQFLHEQPDVLEFEWNSKTYKVQQQQQQKGKKKKKSVSKKSSTLGEDSRGGAAHEGKAGKLKGIGDAAKRRKKHKRSKKKAQASSTQEPKSEL